MTSLPRALCSALAAFVVGVPAPAQDPPNVLLILADDMGVDMLGAYGVGSNPPSTPHLDALAAQGVLFRNAWSAAVCSPTRAGIQTGRHAFRTGIGIGIRYDAEPAAHALLPSEVSLPEMLDEASDSWAHALIGKWHLDTQHSGGLLGPNLAGYQHFAGVVENLDVSVDGYYDWMRVENGVEEVKREYITTTQIDDALAWMQSAPEPWFCFLSLSAPHAPLHAPPAHLHSVDLGSADPVPTQDPVPYYRAMVEAMDTELGRLFASLDPALLARTQRFFVGDNGSLPAVSQPPFVPAHAKGTVYEGGVHVPFVAQGPLVGVPGSESAALVHTQDLFATLAAIAGVDLGAAYPGRAFDGESLLPQLSDPSAPTQRAALYTEFFHPNDAAPTRWPLPCAQGPASSVCQLDLGFGTPGGPQLALCGDPLVQGNSADLQLSGASPSAALLFFVSDQYEPQPALGGSLIPSLDSLVLINTASDPLGGFQTTVPGYYGLGWMYVQALALKTESLPFAFELSNTLRIHYLADKRALRDARYKLIVDAYTCIEELYDLQADPHELNDLLLQPSLDPEAQQSYAALQAELAQLLTSPG